MLTVHPEIVLGHNRKPRAVLLRDSEWTKVMAGIDSLDEPRGGRGAGPDAR